MHTKIGSFTVKIVYLAFILSALLVPLHSASAQDSEGIPIQKDVFLNGSILSVEDMPDQVTVALYDSANAVAPLATQTFSRGQYNLDFEFSKSDGMALGPVARLTVDFTNKLDMGDDPDNPTRVKEIWSEVMLNGQPVGDRTQVPGETMVKLLLASDASISTYLTLVYEGDDNPITTIYRDLPLASTSGASASENIISNLRAANSDGVIRAADNWVDSGANVYTLGKVNIGAAAAPDGISIFQLTDGRMRIYSPQTDNLHLGFRNGSASNPMAWMGVDTSGNYMFGDVNGTPLVAFQQAGNVGIGTGSNSIGYKLTVNGSIGCTEVTVKSNLWADFVFQDDYRLPSLLEVDEYISANRHLPGIPTASEVKEKGISIGSISSKLLQKVEELTLYVIDLKKENDSLKTQLATIQEQLNRN